MESISFEITDAAKAVAVRCHNLKVSIEGIFTIYSAEGYEDAAERLKAIKAAEKELDQARKEITRPMDELKKTVMDFFRTPAEDLRASEVAIKRAMQVWTREQERLRRDEEARLREIARKEQAKLQRAAERAEKAGREEKAAALQREAETVSMPIIAPSTPKVAGISTRKTYRANVVDKMALIRAVANGLVPTAALDVNQKFLSNQARALNTSLDYPGVEVVEDETISSRAS